MRRLHPTGHRELWKDRTVYSSQIGVISNAHPSLKLRKRWKLWLWTLRSNQPRNNTFRNSLATRPQKTLNIIKRYVPKIMWKWAAVIATYPMSTVSYHFVCWMLTPSLSLSHPLAWSSYCESHICFCPSSVIRAAFRHYSCINIPRLVYATIQF